MRKRRETKKQRERREAEEQDKENARLAFESKHKADREEAERRENERYLAQEEERKAREAERKAKEKALDDKIAQLEVELTSLEKTYLETLNLFEIAQLELMAHGGLEQSERLLGARALANSLHHLRVLLMARTAEHDHLVEQRGSGSGRNSAWASFLGLGVVAMGYYVVSRLWAKEAEKK